MYCKKCGNEINPGDRFCKKCGTPVVEIKKENNPAVKTVNQKNTHEIKTPETEKKWIKPLLIGLAGCILLGGGALGAKVFFSGPKEDNKETANIDENNNKSSDEGENSSGSSEIDENNNRSSENAESKEKTIIPIVGADYKWIREAVISGHKGFSCTTYITNSADEVNYETDGYMSFLAKHAYNRKDAYTYDSVNGILKRTIQNIADGTDTASPTYTETQTTETFGENGFLTDFSTDDPNYSKTYGTTEYVYQQASNTLLMKTTFDDQDTVITSELDANGKLLYRNEDGNYKIYRTYKYDSYGNAVSYTEEYYEGDDLFYSSSWTADNNYSDGKLVSVRYSYDTGESYQVDYSYDTKGNLSCMYRDSSKNSFFYNEDNLLVRHEISQRNGSGEWCLMQVSIYEYFDVTNPAGSPKNEAKPDSEQKGDEQKETGQTKDIQYKTEHVVEDVEIDGNKCEIAYDQVILSDEYTYAEKINQYIENDRDRFLSEAKSIAEGTLPAYSGQDVSLFNTFLLENVYVSEEYISILSHENWFMGGVASTNPRAYTFDLKTGDVVNITDVLGMGIQEIQKIYSHTVSKSGHNFDNSIYKSDTDYKYCIKKDNSLFLLFDQYEIASGAEGSFEIFAGTLEQLRP